jgi:hypothetical protein
MLSAQLPEDKEKLHDSINDLEFMRAKFEKYKSQLEQFEVKLKAIFLS